MAASSRTIESGSLIGPYRIAGELGGGGMGLVYRGVDERCGRSAALKVLRPELVEDSDALEHHRVEALALGAIRHPGVVELYDAGWTDAGPFLALELVEAQTLAQWLDARGRLPVPEALGLVRECARTLAAVHDSGVVHRDLKPDNVFLAPGGGVKLFDFGIAKIRGVPAQPRADGMVIGTAAYMAPEQCVGIGECDHRADLYALGCLLFEMITGASPYGFLPARSILTAHVRGPVPDLVSHADVPAAVARLVTRLLAKRPDDRPHDARHVVDLSGGLIDGLGRPGRRLFLDTDVLALAG